MTTPLSTEPRHAVGTRASRKLRATGRIPVALQKDGEKPALNLSIDAEEFLRARRKHEHVFELVIDKAREPVLVNALEWDVFAEDIVHVEFRRVDLTKKTRVEVPIEFTGHPKGVLNHLLTRIAVMTLPTTIPDLIEFSVADMEVGRTVLASELKMPEGVELATAPDVAIARISMIKIEVEAAPAAPTEAEAAAAAATAAATPAGETPAGGAPAKGAEGAPKKGEPAPKAPEGGKKGKG
jgi:large subunit ribosomal protein L25